MEDLVALSIEEMTGLNYMCSCGKNHSVGIETIKVGSGVINTLPTVIKNYEGKQVFIIEDTHTYEVAGKRVEELLNEKFKVSKYIFNEKHLHPNELTLGRLLLEIPAKTDLIIAVGSGTINDISRFLGCKLDRKSVV